MSYAQRVRNQGFQLPRHAVPREQADKLFGDRARQSERRGARYTKAAHPMAEERRFQRQRVNQLICRIIRQESIKLWAIL